MNNINKMHTEAKKLVKEGWIVKNYGDEFQAYYLTNNEGSEVYINTRGDIVEF